MEWKDEAREMRQHGATIEEIALHFGKSRSTAHNTVKDVPYTRAPWREKARQMRSEGARIADIVQAVDRSHGQVVAACQGVVCPVDHVAESSRQNLLVNRTKRIYTRKDKPARAPRIPRAPKVRQPRVTPEWHAEAKRLRSEGMGLREIAQKFGVKIQTVSKLCKGIRCPVDHNSRAQLVAQAKRWEGHVSKPRIRTRNPEKKVRPREELTPAELRHRERLRVLRRALTVDSKQRNVPITLPKLSFLDDAA